MASRPRLRKTIQFGPDRRFIIRRGRAKDGEAIAGLYKFVYGDKYTMPVVIDPGQRNKSLRSKHFLWVLIELDERLVGSVIYEFHPTESLGKVFGAVIDPAYRGHDLMVEAMRAGLYYAREIGLPTDVIYATTRTVSPAPQRIVEKLGFHCLGIFPNVRKVEDYETHGLHVLHHYKALGQRKRMPLLIPEVREFFEISRDEVGFVGHAMCGPVNVPAPSVRPLRFEVDEDEAAVQRLHRKRKKADALEFDFFPFHEAHLRFFSQEEDTEIFLHYNRVDAYGVVLGLRSEREDLRSVLEAASETAKALGMRYIEILISAYDPVLQRFAFESRYLPSAYFPAMRVCKKSGERLDYLVFSRSFEQLDFTTIKLLGPAQRFLEAFMKCWYWTLLRDEPDWEESEYGEHSVVG